MVSSSPWPAGCRGALSLSFDDGIDSQLERGIPIMNEFGLRGSFYLCPRGHDWRERLAPWRAAYDAGHEIGNHTLSHTCSRGFLDDPRGHSLENLTLQDIEADIDQAEERLGELFPYETPRSFCYPCYQNHVGEGETRQSYTPVVARRFCAARGQGEWPNHPLTSDLHYLWSWPLRGNSAMELLGMAEQCANRGRWGIMTFHGIQMNHLSVAEAEFRELCTHLAHANHIWVAPVKEIAEAVWAWRKSNAEAK